MTPTEFEALCACHDWYYEFSDDSNVYARGYHYEKQLQEKAKNNPEFQRIFNRFVDERIAKVTGR